MRGVDRVRWNSLAMVCVLLILSAAPGMGDELEVTQGEGAGCYLIGMDTQQQMEVCLRFEDSDPRVEENQPECRRTRCSYLIVSRRFQGGEWDEIGVLLGDRSEVVDVKAIAEVDRLILAVEMHHELPNSMVGGYEDRWVAVEVGQRLSLLQNLAQQAGYSCSRDLLRPRAVIEPKWMIQDDQLWMSTRLESLYCWIHGREQRGTMKWRVGESPVAKVPKIYGELERLRQVVSSFGYKPSVDFKVGRNLWAMLAEIPADISKPRVLAVSDRKERSAILFLPRFALDKSLLVKSNDQLDDPNRRLRGPAKWLADRWPQFDHPSAFEWSQNFRDARPEPSVRTLIKNRRVSLSELSIPCVEAIEPASAKTEAERWLLRVERVDGELEVETAILEPCSFALASNSVQHWLALPAADMVVSKDAVRVTYQPPELDVEALADDKFLFFNWKHLNERFSTAQVEMFLDAPTNVIQRCEPALPTSGRGWVTAETDGCRVSVRSFPPGGGYRQYPPDQIPPRFVEPPAIAGWCANVDEGPNVLRFYLKVRDDASIVWGDEGVPRDILSDINQWTVKPGTDAQGEQVTSTLSVEVARGLPRPAEMALCQ